MQIYQSYRKQRSRSAVRRSSTPADVTQTKTVPGNIALGPMCKFKVLKSFMKKKIYNKL